jgi:Dimerisation domain
MVETAGVRDQKASYELLDLIQGAVVTQALHVAAKLGIADVLCDGPLSADEISSRVGSDPTATHRLLRALSGYQVFAVRGEGRYELTPMAEKLREDAQSRGVGVPDEQRRVR